MHVPPWLDCHPITAVAGLCLVVVAQLWVIGSCLNMGGHDPTFFLFNLFYFFIFIFMQGRVVFSIKFSIIYLRENGRKF
jgi:hypothetical protein